MPANSEETLLPIMETLEMSMAKDVMASDVPKCEEAQSRKVLMQKIHFLPAEKSCHSQQLELLLAKYTPLNGSSGEYSPPKPVAHYKSPQNIKMSGDDLPTPKVVLFPPENVNPDWQEALSVGSGLVNMGNTCFLNSILQCLTYTAPLVNYLMEDDHCKSCNLVGLCMLCELHRHIKCCFKQSGRIEPRSIVDKLQVIAKHMHLGRQEDAQEFLRYVVDRMQEACLSDHKQLDYVSKQTTAISQIFGGYLRSQVVCLKCKAKSNTYEMFMDISLDIENAPSVIKAFEKYTQPEKLDIDNAYNCTECRQKVTAEKKFTIYKAPNVLTIQLKRFDYFRHLAKVTRHVKFSEQLDLQPFMSNKEDTPVLYELYAVLVHSGYACTSGHYYCYIKAPNSVWYCMNDQHVTQVSISRVLNAEAYLLFYKRLKAKVPTSNDSSSTPTEQKPSTSSDEPSSDLSSSAEMTSSVQSGSTGSDGDGDCNGDGGSDCNTQQTITESKPQKSSVPAALEQPVENSKPRLVIRIKHGAVCYNSVSDSMKSEFCSSGKHAPKSVPYTDESDGSEESVQDESDASELSNRNDQSSKSTKCWMKKSKKLQEPMVDRSLEATTSVPGCYAALDKVASWMAARKARKMFNKRQVYTFPGVNKSDHLKKSSSGQAFNANLPKVNATGKWNIWNSGACLSTSLSSTSSTSSLDSTAADVKPQVRQQRSHVPKFKQFGWTATRKKNERNEMAAERPAMGKSPDLSAYDFHEEDSPTLISFNRARSHIRDARVLKVDAETSCCELPTRRHKKHKKKKKHKKHKKRHREELEEKGKEHKGSSHGKWKNMNNHDDDLEDVKGTSSCGSTNTDDGCLWNGRRVDKCYAERPLKALNENADLGKRGRQWSSPGLVKRIKLCHDTEDSDYISQ